jgi:hypothetical protein
MYFPEYLRLQNLSSCVQDCPISQHIRKLGTPLHLSHIRCRQSYFLSVYTNLYHCVHCVLRSGSDGGRRVIVT